MSKAKVDWATAVSIAQDQLRTSIDSDQPPERPPADKYRSFFRYDATGPLAHGCVIDLREKLLNSGSCVDSWLHQEIIGCAEAMLREGIALPSWLTEYTADVLRSQQDTGSPSTPKRSLSHRRDIGIKLALLQLVQKHGMPAYSNNPAEPADYQTACGAVTEALRRERPDLELSERSIKRMWRRKYRRT